MVTVGFWSTNTLNKSFGVKEERTVKIFGAKNMWVKKYNKIVASFGLAIYVYAIY